MIMSNPVEYITESKEPVSYYFINGAGTLKTVTRYTTTAKKELLGEKFNPADKVFVEPNSVSTVVYTFE